jgi:anti-sigma factor RsiW
MANTTRHPTDALHDALDDRLDAAQRAALDEHLATCADCRRELDALAWTKDRVGTAARTVETPDDLESHLKEALDREESRAAGPGQPGTSTRRYWLAAAAAVTVLGIGWILRSAQTTNPPAQAAADFRALVSGAAPVSFQTADPSALETQLRTAQLRFAVRVFDFGMMNYTLLGGGVHRFAGSTSARFAYRSSDGRTLVCQMYEGRIDELPPPAERRRQNDIDFLIYREGELTVVFWQEGDVVCVLVADGDREAAIRLAFAKAVKL